MFVPGAMNISLLLLPSLMTYSTISPRTLIPRNRLERVEQIVNLPSLGVALPACPFCDLSRCHPLPFCYTLKHGLRGVSMGEHCGSESELSSLVRDRLAFSSTNDACQPAVADPQLAYCWCQNITRRVTVEEQLRHVRIWRYQPLKWHADHQDNDCSSQNILLGAIALLFSRVL